MDVGPATGAAWTDGIEVPIPAATCGDVLDVECSSDDVGIENTLETDEEDDDSIIWTVVEDSSRQRHPKLTSSSGHSYNIKRTNKNGTVDWQCSRRERRAGVLCRATVKQCADVFVPGPSGHCHPPQAKVHTIRAAVENTICDPAPMETDVEEDDSIVWTVVKASSRQHHPKLTSSTGHSYNIKRTNKNGTVDWQCSRRDRRAGVLCRATVKQFGDVYVPGSNEHCHPPQAKVHTIWEADVSAACDNLLKSAGKQ